MDLNGCEEATWEQLTQIQKLGRYQKDPFIGQGLHITFENENNLDGIVNLEKGSVAISNLDTGLPRLAQLAEIEGLRALALWTANIPALPADLLIHTQHLTSLLIAGNKISSIPEGFLSPTQQLTSLTLNSTVLLEIAGGVPGPGVAAGATIGFNPGILTCLPFGSHTPFDQTGCFHR